MTTALDFYLLFWVCILGLCMGSFFNVVILRSISGENIAFPPSKCPKCNNTLKPWHNIPILSYILLKGRCYYCHKEISLQYPLVELLTMILYAIAFIKFGVTLKTVFAIFWISSLIIMTGTDIKEKLVDCNIAIIMGLTGTLYFAIQSSWRGCWESVLGAIIGILILELIARCGFVFAKTRAMGEADTYVAGALGAIVGYHHIVPVLLYGLIASMIFILPKFLYYRYKANDKLTFNLSILFIIGLLTFKYIGQNYWTVGLLLSLGIALVWSIHKGLEDEGNRNYLPYVPALTAGFLYFLLI